MGTEVVGQTRNGEYGVGVGSLQDHKDLQEAWVLMSS